MGLKVSYRKLNFDPPTEGFSNNCRSNVFIKMFLGMGFLVSLINNNFAIPFI